MAKFGSKALWRSLIAVSGILLPVAIGGKTVTDDWSGYINKFLHISSTKIVEGDKDEDPIHFKSKYTSYKDVMEHARSVAKEVAGEGTVLMTNKNHALPLEEKSKVTFFGYNSVDVALGGTGSGGVSSSAERKYDLKKACANGSDVKLDANQKMFDFYQQKYDAKVGFIESSGWGGKTQNFRAVNAVNEIPASDFTSTETDSFAQYKDAAIFVLTRIGGEGSDLKASYLELTDEEKSVLQAMKDGPFTKRIVLVNTFNTPELGWLDDYNIDAALYIGGPGEVGLDAVTDILVGRKNPSGALADTYAYDIESAPSMQNFGDFTFANASDIVNPDSKKYLMYEEGIYVGYRYYETRYEDSVLGRGNASSTAGAKLSPSGWEYQKEVQFPFGYGLSYADFTETLTNASVDWDNKSAQFTVNVKNTSKIYAGKDVVELYAQTPYTEGGLEKSSIQLCGFAKTGEIAPGKDETLTINVDLHDIATYDYKVNKTYVMEKGDYYFAIGSDVHDALNNILAAKNLKADQASRMDSKGDSSKAYKKTKNNFSADEYKLSKNQTTITNQFDNADINSYVGGTSDEVTYLSRKDWNTTYPKHQADFKANSKMLDEIASYYSEKNDGTTIPSAYKKGSSDTSSITTGAEKKYTLAMMIGADYDDENWDKLLDQLTIQDYLDSTSQGRKELASVGLNATTAVDGPAAWTKSTYIEDYKNQYNADKVVTTKESLVSYPTETIIAGTWNIDLTKELGDSFGEEGLWGGGVGWYGPAANTHRTACGGRNFEYFSEDSYLAGKLCEAEVHGAMVRGTIPYLKHFFLNDQETNRIGVCTFANEQSIREIYLRAFQYAFETTGKDDPSCSGAMGGFNRLGLVWTGHDGNLWHNVMEKEWGFKGNVTTDFGQKQGSLMEPELAYEAGTTTFCTSGTGFAKYLQGVDITKDYKLMSNMREAIHRLLYNFANSAAMNGLTSSSRIVDVPTWYQIALLVVIIVSAVVFAVAVVFYVLSLLSYRKEKEAK